MQKVDDGERERLKKYESHSAQQIQRKQESEKKQDSISAKGCPKVMSC